MFPKEFLPDPSLKIEQAEVDKSKATICLRLDCTRRQSTCPKYYQISARIHSYYERHVADLPCSGFRMDMVTTPYLVPVKSGKISRPSAQRQWGKAHRVP